MYVAVNARIGATNTCRPTTMVSHIRSISVLFPSDNGSVGPSGYQECVGRIGR
jgi:hypothetical protein